MAIVMKLWGSASTGPTPFDGQYLKDFDFEAHGGRGELVVTADIAEAKRFADLIEQHAYYCTQPKCLPFRPDFKPNRPLTASNWEIVTVDDGEDS